MFDAERKKERKKTDEVVDMILDMLVDEGIDSAKCLKAESEFKEYVSKEYVSKEIFEKYVFEAPGEKAEQKELITAFFKEIKRLAEELVKKLEQM